MPLVILDLLPPKVSGFELLSEWRGDPRTADLSIFVLTSKELSKDEEKYLRTNSEYLYRKQQPWQEDVAWSPSLSWRRHEATHSGR